MDTSPQIIASLLALGVALAFIVADREAPTTRALALFLASIGISIYFSLFTVARLAFTIRAPAKRSRKDAGHGGECQ